MSFLTAAGSPQAAELGRDALAPPDDDRTGTTPVARDLAGPPGPDVTRRRPAERVSSLELEARPRDAGWVRRYVTAALCAWRLGPETIQAAEMVVGEMIANAIQAVVPSPEPRACPGPDVAALVTVTLRLLPGLVVIEVADADPCPPVLGKPGLDAESGRGLVIVDAIARQWGFRHAPDGGKVTFAVLAIAATGEHSSGGGR